MSEVEENSNQKTKWNKESIKGLWATGMESLKIQNLLRFLPLLLLFFVFSIIFIYKNHQVAKTLKEIGELKREIKELRAEESAIKFDLMNQSRQSKIIQKLEGTGIKELRTPPYKIKKSSSE